MMRLVFLVVLVLIAFAGNSILTRAALALGEIGPGPFTAIRISAGAAMLAVLVSLKGQKVWQGGSATGVASLFIYAVALSFAYIDIPTGLGALILFGAVQFTMFAMALFAGERPSLARWVGSALGLVGLFVLFAPGGDALDLWAALMMAVSGVAWGIYSVAGRGAHDATLLTAGNFLWAVPLGLITWALFPDGSPSATGVGLAVMSGAITSGLGYALWYAVLPKLDTSLAAVAQLCVPVIALVGGMIVLGEPATWRFALAAAMILGGVGLAVFGPKKAIS